MEEVLQRLGRLGVIMLLCLPAALIWRLVQAVQRKKRRSYTTGWHELGAVLFIVFMAGLFSQTILPPWEWKNGTLLLVNDGVGSINVIPFRIFSDCWEQLGKHNISYVLISLLGNIAVFLPIGFFIPLLWRPSTLGQSLSWGFCISLLIELCQLLLPRSTDIDDLLLNLAGALTGYAIYRGLAASFPYFDEKFKVQIFQNRSKRVYYSR